VWRSRLRSLIRPSRVEAELDEEIRFHIEELTAQLVARGHSPEEARAEARRSFGGVEQVKEECRDVQGLRWLWSFLADSRYGWRVIRRSPGFALLVVLSLAIGIGANTAIFSLADAALFRPLPVPHRERLVELISVWPGHRQTNLPAEVFEHVRRETRAFEGLAASWWRTSRLRIAGGPSESVRALFVSGSFFRMLGVRPTLGRLLREEDDRPGASRVVVLSETFWTRRLGRRPDVVGETLRVQGAPATIVGVTSGDFVGVDRSFRADVLLPLSADRPTAALWIVGRLRPGVSRAEATATIQPLFRRALESMDDETRRWPAQEREQFLSQRLELAPAGTGTAALRWQLAQPLQVLASVVLAVLFIACTNVAALTLARGDRRAREIAVRLALGAGRGRVVRQLLTESMQLAVLGGLAAIALAYGLHEILLGLLPLDPTAAVGFRVDWHVLGFTAAIATLAGVLTGIIPAVRLTRVDVQPVLKGERGALGRARSRTLHGILVAQVAGTLVLLTMAGLFLRSLTMLYDTDMGFDRRNLLLGRVAPAGGEGEVAPVRGEQLVAHLRAQPGVEAAALAARPVFSGREPWILTAWVDGYEYRPGEDQRVAFNAIGPGFFRTAGIPLLAGRDFTTRDGPAAPRVAIVNRSFAGRYFGEGSGLGRRLGTAGAESSREIEVVGVVADSKPRNVRERSSPALFLPIHQQGSFRSLALHVRTTGFATGRDAIARAVREAGPGLELASVTSLGEMLSDSLQRDSMFAGLTTVFGAMALLLTGVGIHGSMAYAASRRTHEIGIRRALGAGRGSIAWLMLKEAALVVGLGVAIGLPLAAVGERALRSLLFGLRPFDPVALLSAAVLLAGGGALAALPPARWAALQHPMRALRHE
jgi:predicted permease